MTNTNVRGAALEQTDVSRRRLVKGAATLAWTVPAVQIASAVPAHATGSKGACDIQIVSAGASLAQGRNQPTGTFSTEVTIKNAGRAAATQVKVTLKFSPRYGDLVAGPAPAGWTHVSTTQAYGCTFITYMLVGELAPGARSGAATFVATGKIVNTRKPRWMIVLTGGRLATGTGTACGGDYDPIQVDESKCYYDYAGDHDDDHDDDHGGGHGRDDDKDDDDKGGKGKGRGKGKGGKG